MGRRHLVEDEATIHRLRTHLAEILAANPRSTSVDAILPVDLLDVGEDRSISAIAFPHERGAGHGRRTLTVARIGEHVARYPDIAYDGDFFLVNGDYVQRVDREIAQIPESQVVFPVYRGETEPLYNAKIGKDHPDESSAWTGS